MTSIPRFLYGILGKPLGHSVSPALHNWGFAETGYPGAYFAWEKDADELPGFFKAVRSLPVSGLSVTIPYKEAVIPYLDALTPQAGQTGAVNTVFWRHNALWGDNTDVTGFVAPLRGLAAASLPRNALVLGAGGACRAALAGLATLGLHGGAVRVAARDPGKAAALGRAFGCGIVNWRERETALASAAPLLVINATPLGMRGERQEQSPLPENALARLAPGSIAYDLVYAPRKTLFLQQAEAHGLKTLEGLSFFIAQGRAQFSLWTGLDLPQAGAEALVTGALAASGAAP